MSELFAAQEQPREQSQDFLVAESDDRDNSGRDITGTDNADLDITDLDVIVIGAGIAGLMVATRLIEAGLRCRVLEHHDRVGGRLLTHRETDHKTENKTEHKPEHKPEHDNYLENRLDNHLDNHLENHGHFDLGATWYWPGETRVAALIKELDVPTHAHHLAGDAMYHAPGGAQRINGNPIDVVSGRFSHGAASLTDRLAERLGDAVSLKTTVHHIEYRPEHGNGPLTVTHNNGSLTAQHVVLAIPPSVAVRCIEFEPALPPDLAALAAATPVWMGNIVKVVVIYQHAFWQHAGLSGAAMSHIGPLREIHDMSGAHFETAALFGFVPLGPDAPVPQEIDVINQLVEIFGPEAASPLKVVIKDWRNDATITNARVNKRVPSQEISSQEILGQETTSQEISSQRSTIETYGHPLYQVPVSNLKNNLEAKNLETINLEISRSIHWASTETAPVSPGHIEGALAAAERAIKAIIH